MLRIHAGLEDADDLIADLENGLGRLRSTISDRPSDLHAAFVAAVKFDDKGLVPVIAQSKATGEVLMFAWMNRQTLEDDPGHRARHLLVPLPPVGLDQRARPAATTSDLVEAYIDCDGDVLLLKVDQMGPACHTGAPSCFFRKLG